MTSHEEQRVLALDIHPRSFGFVILEGPDKILDWGARSFRTGRNSVRVEEGPKLARLLRQYAPRVILSTRPPRRNTARMNALIREEAAMRQIPVRTLPPDVLREEFSQCATRYEMAATIAVRLPELCNILPPKRKPWKSEHYRMSIFDAAAIGIAHFQSQTREHVTVST